MMSVQLGETFSGFKIHRPVQWVRDQNPLLFKYNDYELPKIFVPHWFLKACHGSARVKIVASLVS